MSRHVVPVPTVRLALANRRADLEHLRASAELEAASIIESRLAELDLCEAALDRALAEHARPDPTVTTRPGVLLVGAGVRGTTTVPVDAETLDPAHLSDRDLAVFGGLLRYAADRLAREVADRLVAAYPQRWVTGYGPNAEDLLAAAADAGTVRPLGWTLGDPSVADTQEDHPR